MAWPLALALALAAWGAGSRSRRSHSALDGASDDMTVLPPSIRAKPPAISPPPLPDLQLQLGRLGDCQVSRGINLSRSRDRNIPRVVSIDPLAHHSSEPYVHQVPARCGASFFDEGACARASRVFRVHEPQGGAPAVAIDKEVNTFKQIIMPRSLLAEIRSCRTRCSDQDIPNLSCSAGCSNSA